MFLFLFQALVTLTFASLVYMCWNCWNTMSRAQRRQTMKHAKSTVQKETRS